MWWLFLSFFFSSKKQKKINYINIQDNMQNLKPAVIVLFYNIV